MNSRYSPNSSNDKTLTIQIIVAVVFVAGLAFFTRAYGSTDAIMIFDFGAQQRAFQGKAMPNMTLLDALNQVGDAGQLAIYNLHHSAARVVIMDVNKEFIPQEVLAVYHNGTKVDLGRLDRTFLKPNDKVLVIVGSLNEE